MATFNGDNAASFLFTSCMKPSPASRTQSFSASRPFRTPPSRPTPSHLPHSYPPLTVRAPLATLPPTRTHTPGTAAWPVSRFPHCWGSFWWTSQTSNLLRIKELAVAGTCVMLLAHTASPPPAWTWGWGAGGRKGAAGRKAGGRAGAVPVLARCCSRCCPPGTGPGQGHDRAAAAQRGQQHQARKWRCWLRYEHLLLQCIAPCPRASTFDNMRVSYRSPTAGFHLLPFSPFPCCGCRCQRRGAGASAGGCCWSWLPCRSCRPCSCTTPAYRCAARCTRWLARWCGCRMLRQCRRSGERERMYRAVWAMLSGRSCAALWQPLTRGVYPYCCLQAKP